MAIHAAAVGAAVWLHAPDAPPREPDVVYFEILEEAIEQQSDNPVNQVSQEIQTTTENQETSETCDEVVAKPASLGFEIISDTSEISDAPEISNIPDNSEIMDDHPSPLSENPQPPPPQSTVQPPSLPPSDATEHAAIISPPSALNRITPVYPRSARRKGHEGCVTLELRISTLGRVIDAHVLSSSGFSDLDRAALDAASSAAFAPASDGGTPVEGSIRLTFDFKLK